MIEIRFEKVEEKEDNWLADQYGWSFETDQVFRKDEY